MNKNSIKSKIKLIFIFAIFFILGNNNCQNSNYKIVQSERNNVIFTAELKDEIFNYGDTLIIFYSVKNNSEKPIYIFSPELFYNKVEYQPNYDSCNCQFDFDLGGSFQYHYGYKTFIKLLKLESCEIYKFTFKILLKYQSKYDHCKYGINRLVDDDKWFTSLFVFNIGFIFDNEILEFKNEDISDYFDFKTLESAIYFESNLDRFLLGPLFIKINSI